MRSQIGHQDISICEVPYLTQDDVADMVQRSKGDAIKWAPILFAVSGGGHPALVDAALIGLLERGWPEREATISLFSETGVSQDLEEQKNAILLRLQNELYIIQTPSISLIFG
jgi:hypothetical protein